MCTAGNCLEWPTIFIFFRSRGIYLNLLELLPEIRDTVTGNHAINTGHFFFSPKNKKTFLWITFVQGGASETIQRKLLNFPREDEQRCVTSFGPYDDLFLFLSFFPLPKFVFEIRNTIHNRRR